MNTAIHSGLFEPAVNVETQALGVVDMVKLLA